METYKAEASYGGRPTNQTNGRKRKGADDYAAENADDFEARTVIRDGQKVRVIICRYCCQAIGARSDRIKEHLASKRHSQSKAGNSPSGSGSGAETPRSSVSSTSSRMSTSPPKKPAALTATLRLKWSGCERNMAQLFAKYRDDNKLTDVTLWCGEKSLDCHKIVLCAGSDYLEQILMAHNMNSPEKPSVFLCGIKFWQLKALVNFMYCGEVCVAHDKIQELLTAADHLKIKGLARRNGI